MTKIDRHKILVSYQCLHDSSVKVENYITEQKKAEEMYNGAEILVDLARRYPELWNEIDRQCTLNRERYGLLCEILLAGDEERCEDVVAKIYRYGSMIGKQDLIGRQIFLWLLQALRMEEIAML